MSKQKTNPFKVPEGYFDSLPGRLEERIAGMETENVPVRRLYKARVGIAIAATLAAMALVTFPLIRMLSPASAQENDFMEIALLDGAGLFASDYELAAYLEGSESSMDDDDAYLSQAIEYLASTDVEMDLIFE